MPAFMPDQYALRTIRAAVEAIVPPVDGAPGAADLGVERHVVLAFEQFIPGFVDLLVALLDAYANEVRAGVQFADLTLEERGHVFGALAEEEGNDLRDIFDGLLVFTYGGMYSEWTGYDKATRTLSPPAVWADMGHAGPVHGYPTYRESV